MTGETLMSPAAMPALRRLIHSERCQWHDEWICAAICALAVRDTPLSDFRVTGRAWLRERFCAAVAKLPHLTELHMSSRNVDREGFTQLARCPALTALAISGISTDYMVFPALLPLGALKPLQRLTLSHCWPKSGVVEQLQALRPDLRVLHYR
jgi:hypothetical protein